MTKVVPDAGERKGGLHFHGRRLAPWQVYLFSSASSRLRDCDEQCRCVVAARMASSTLAALFVEGRGGSFPNMRATRFTSSRPPVHISPSPPLRPRIDQATLLALPLLPSCFSLPCFPHFTHQLTTALPSSVLPALFLLPRLRLLQTYPLSAVPPPLFPPLPLVLRFRQSG